MERGSPSLRAVVANNIKTARLRAGLSQEELAGICGYHRTYISSIEREERNITLDTLQAIATALKVGPASLLSTSQVAMLP